MALFGRNKEVDTVPEEVREYYQSEKRERTGLAWLLAVGTLVVTLILAAGLFFGGRWAYHKLTSNDHKKTPVATQSQKQDTTETKDTKSKSPSKPQSSAPSTSTGTTTPTAASTSTPSTSSTAPKPAPTPSTTPAQTTLVNTGPSDVIAIFVIIVIAGTLYHRFVLSRLS